MTSVRRILLATVALLFAWPDAASAAEVVHPIRVHHPGSSDDEPTPLELVRRLDDQGETTGFHCDTTSVFCADSTCTLVGVRIFWNEIGGYERYELPPGAFLEKAEGEPFTPEDHKRLHEILDDRSSPLKRVRLSDIKGHEAQPDGVDAVSGATPKPFEDAAVKGAAWTSFTLWHWVNGGIRDEIRAIAAKQADIADLRGYLANDDVEYKSFALEQLLARRAYDSETIAAVRTHAPNTDREVTQLTLEYIKGGPESAYFPSMERLFAAGDSRERLSVLNAVLRTDVAPTPEDLHRFRRHLADAGSYQEVHLLLRFLEQEKDASEETIELALALLDDESFFIARRAFWFLEKQSVTASRAARLEAFRDKHRDRL